MTAPFLTYELLTPETADPVVIRITGQRERGFPKLICDNGIAIMSKCNPEYDAPFLFVWGEDESDDADLVYIPLADWPAVKQAIRELNEHYKEKDMNLKSEGERILNILKSSIEPTGDTYRDVVRLIENSLAENERLLNLYQQAVKGRQDFRNAYRKEKDMKHEKDEYLFPRDEWDWSHLCGNSIVVTRKKPKVKVEWSNCSRFGDGLGENGIDFSRHGYCRYHIVQFRVTGWDGEERYETPCRCIPTTIALSPCVTVTCLGYNESAPYWLGIGLDARDKWSAPVLLPESVYSRLDEICAALESKANEVKG